MHMADALVSPAVAAGMAAGSTLLAGYSIKKIKLEGEQKKIPVMGVMGAFVFAAQMINFSIPGTGSSGHLCGGVMLAALLGPYASFLTMIGILVIQCLMFGDGGLLALGCNVWNMAAYGCFIGGGLIWKGIMRRGISKRKIAVASITACVLTLQFGAFSVVLETSLSGISELPFNIFAGSMQLIHLPIGLVEGVITATVLSFIYEARPELLWSGKNSEIQTGKISKKVVILVIAAISVITAGVISLFASSSPDGLEWSIFKVTGSEELESGDMIHSIFAKIQNFTAVLPDYSFKSSDSLVGTSVAGIVGVLLIIAICFAVGYIVRNVRKKKVYEQG